MGSLSEEQGDTIASISIDDTVVSHDDTLAREREELFNRLDELNRDTLTSTADNISQNGNHSLPSPQKPGTTGNCHST